MPRRLRYFAQPFWRGRQEPATLHEFMCAQDAEEGGEILARSADGVLVYQQWCDEDAALYEEPEILAEMGEVPIGARCIDGEGREPWLDDVA